MEVGPEAIWPLASQGHSRFSPRDIGANFRFSLRDIGSKFIVQVADRCTLDRQSWIQSAQGGLGSGCRVVRCLAPGISKISFNRVGHRMETTCTQPFNCVCWSPSMRVMQAHSTVILKPVFRNIGEEQYRSFQKWRLDNDMLQQCELWVMRCEKEGPSRVHFNSKILRVKWMKGGWSLAGSC